MMQKHFVIEQLIMNGKSLVISRMMLSNKIHISRYILVDTFTNDCYECQVHFIVSSLDMFNIQISKNVFYYPEFSSFTTSSV